jgi:hypothetical protein
MAVITFVDFFTLLKRVYTIKIPQDIKTNVYIFTL